MRFGHCLHCRKDTVCIDILLSTRKKAISFCIAKNTLIATHGLFCDLFTMDDKKHTALVWDENLECSVPAVVYDEKHGLYFTQADIQEFICCKAAAFTMVATLLDHCGLTPGDLGSIYLAGGFGTHIDVEYAVTVGIYPDVDRSKLIPLGNTSLAGAKKLLLDSSCLERLKGFQENATYLHFSEMDKFLENMVAARFIPHTDRSLYPSVPDPGNP